ncbi:CpsD/CapB family tyrosine-protein kinase [Bradyrhizobium sp. WYCCWR 13023]|uniref:CpsD/CapB family tyrosine-protein kinase n=1 Tax=Bradyrhizobium zhengyangense TaxID=2911009 RepID=A0A9X1RM24_9BRAD|nr:CpsD/CapB family tyrosine-protein kinase [Bradyrhizobium zhengyangense]MCG2632710.1 CpsD/CapB family tyrosine-protein kinase [Bradyrhizobium zhengyangense]
MDSIKHAVELARAAEAATTPGTLPNAARQDFRSEMQDSKLREVRLNPDHLEKSRLVGHKSKDDGRYYDMLRTEVLQEMDKKSWQFLSITSPTAACGKSLTACNLALSIARLPERSVLLVDLDLRKPMVANYLGLQDGPGILDVLEGRATLSAATLRASIGPSSIFVLPGSTPSSNSSEWMASQSMGTLLHAIKREFRSCIVIFDLPPILLGDDVISILPRMEATLLVAGVGNTSLADMRESQKHLQRTSVVRVVVNKVTEAPPAYYGYY